MTKSMVKTAVVVPNWNSLEAIGRCLDSLLAQSIDTEIIVAENGSKDGSLEFVQKNYPTVDLVVNKKNLGFAGGVNSGIKKAMRKDFEYIALFNNDAIADKNWLIRLVDMMDNNPNTGIVACKFISMDKKSLDSTGDFYTNWGLPYPRGRGEKPDNQYDKLTDVFAGSGGASLYRTKMLEDIGIFDEDFFAYYEDVDISFRAQLAGWKVKYAPNSIAYHETGSTSGKIKGFTTYQSMKNLPWLYWKNIPTKYLFRVGWRFSFVYFLFFFGAIQRGQGLFAFKGFLVSLVFLPKKITQRLSIQASKRVTPEYIWGIMIHDLPPSAHRLRALRSRWWKLRRKDSV